MWPAKSIDQQTGLQQMSMPMYTAQHYACPEQMYSHAPAAAAPGYASWFPAQQAARAHGYVSITRGASPPHPAMQLQISASHGMPHSIMASPQHVFSTAHRTMPPQQTNRRVAQGMMLAWPHSGLANMQSSPSASKTQAGTKHSHRCSSSSRSYTALSPGGWHSRSSSRPGSSVYSSSKIQRDHHTNGYVKQQQQRPFAGSGGSRMRRNTLMNNKPADCSDAAVEEFAHAVRHAAADQQLAQQMLVDGLQHLDSRGLAALLKGLARSRHGHRAREIFDFLRMLPADHAQAQMCDVFTYTAMVSLCVEQQELQRAFELVAEMKQRNVERNVHTYTALMNVAIKCGQLQQALGVYSEMLREGCTPNVVTYNTLIDVYGKTSQWGEALKVIDHMHATNTKPVTRTYNTLMIACNTSGQWQEALNVYDDMVRMGHAPNTTTYNALISAHSKAGRLEKVMDVYHEMLRTGCERGVITYSALISACEKAGQWQLALNLFNEMLEEKCSPNVITYNSLITACAQGAQWTKAAEVFEQMQSKGCKPDVVTYTALVSAYERGGQWMKALEVFQQMMQQRCKSDAILYNTLLDVLWDTGVLWAQRKAGQLFRQAVHEGHFRVQPLPQSQQLVASRLSPDDQADNKSVSGPDSDEAGNLAAGKMSGPCAADPPGSMSPGKVLKPGPDVQAGKQSSTRELSGADPDNQAGNTALPPSPDDQAGKATVSSVSATGPDSYVGGVPALEASGPSPDDQASSMSVTGPGPDGQSGSCLSLKNYHQAGRIATSVASLGSATDDQASRGQPGSPSVTSVACVDVSSNCSLASPAAGGSKLELSLQGVSAGVAMLMLHCWLADLRDHVLQQQQQNCLPDRITISTGRSRQRDHISGILRDSIAALLDSWQSPFAVVRSDFRTNNGSSSSSVNSGSSGSYLTSTSGSKLEAPGAAVAEWVLQDHMQPLLEPFADKKHNSRYNNKNNSSSLLCNTSSAASAATAAGGTPAELAAQVALGARCKEAFAAVKAFEDTHNLSVQSMGVCYTASRAGIVTVLLSAGERLGIRDDVVHDAVLLMDRAMSTEYKVDEDVFTCLAAACLHITASSTCLPTAAPALADICTALGCSCSQTAADMVDEVMEALHEDTSSISALRCVKLYLERLGHEFGPDGSCSSHDMIADTLNLVSRAAKDSEFLNYRPTITAAAVLYCERLQQGLLPFWPSSLATLTGYSNARTAELAAAINGAHRLIKQKLSSSKKQDDTTAAARQVRSTAVEHSLTAAPQPGSASSHHTATGQQAVAQHNSPRARFVGTASAPASALSMSCAKPEPAAAQGITGKPATASIREAALAAAAASNAVSEPKC